MAAPNNYYVDPLNGDDTTGDGLSDGTAWQTLAKAAATISRDTTDGDRINVKDSATATVTAALALAGSSTAPWIIQGYTSTSGDGGIGVISGGGTVSIYSNAAGTGILFMDLELTNTGANTIVLCDNFCRFVNVYFHDTTGDGIDADNMVDVFNCRLENIGGVGVNAFYGHVSHCYFANGANSFTTAVTLTSALQQHCVVCSNIFNLSGTSAGVSISANDAGASVFGNSFFTSGTGTALDLTTDANAGAGNLVANNLFEGWTLGLDLSAATTQSVTIVQGNAGFDNDTDFDISAEIVLVGDNEALAASPFAKSGAATFANRNTYFKPVDTGNVLSPAGGLTGAKGAVQPGFVESGGGASLIGGGLVHVG